MGFVTGTSYERQTEKVPVSRADRHDVFFLQGDTGAEIDVPRVLLRLPKDEADAAGLSKGVFKLEEAAAVLQIGVGEGNGVDAGVAVGAVPAVGLVPVCPAAGGQILRDAAFAVDRIAEHLIHSLSGQAGDVQLRGTGDVLLHPRPFIAVLRRDEAAVGGLPSPS